MAKAVGVARVPKIVKNSGAAKSGKDSAVVKEAVPVNPSISRMPNSQFSIKIENVVAFTSLNITISLNKLVNNVENTEYEPEQFPGLVYRPTNPRSAALIFSGTC